MIIIKITGKTVRIEAEPGERIGLDRDGFCYDSITFRFCGNENLREKLLDCVRSMKDMSSLSPEEIENTYDRRERLLNKVFELPHYRSRKVFVGHSY